MCSSPLYEAIEDASSNSQIQYLGQEPKNDFLANIAKVQINLETLD